MSSDYSPPVGSEAIIPKSDGEIYEMTFTNTEFGNLDVLIENDKYYFPASECAEKLGYVNPRKAILDHCPHVTKRDIGVRTGLKADGTPAFQTVTKTFIPECDLYRLIVRSKLPVVQKFENWVFEDVLPTIRKHGAYIMPELLEELQRNTAKNAELLSQLATHCVCLQKRSPGTPADDDAERHYHRARKKEEQITKRAYITKRTWHT